MSGILGAASGGMLAGGIIITIFLLFILFIVLIGIAARYKKCPSDQVLVIFGKTRGDKAARCIHGGAAFIWPVIQDYGFLSLRPLQIEVSLSGALCKQNIRINVPSVFTVGVSTDNSLMGNAANRLLGISQEEIAALAKDIIFGQLRLVIASMTIEQINSDRETFLRNIEQNVAEELNKIGLQLLNVNITDITDESGYIDAIGKRAAAEAINKARIDVAEEERKGGIGEAEARKAQRIAVSLAEAEAQTGEANADKERRIAVKLADAEAQTGEANADKERRIAVKLADAEAQTGEANADRDRRIAIKQADAAAIEGENVSAIETVSNRKRRHTRSPKWQSASPKPRSNRRTMKPKPSHRSPARKWRWNVRRLKISSKPKLKRNRPSSAPKRKPKSSAAKQKAKRMPSISNSKPRQKVILKSSKQKAMDSIRLFPHVEMMPMRLLKCS